MQRIAPRIHVLLASQTPVGLVIRRGPSKCVATVLWDRRRDEFCRAGFLANGDHVSLHRFALRTNPRSPVQRGLARSPNLRFRRPFSTVCRPDTMQFPGEVDAIG